MIVLLAASSRIKEPFRPEKLPVTPVVGALEDLHHEGDEEGARRDGRPLHNNVLAAAVVGSVRENVCITLYFNQDSFSALWVLPFSKAHF